MINKREFKTTNKSPINKPIFQKKWKKNIARSIVYYMTLNKFICIAKLFKCNVLQAKVELHYPMHGHMTKHILHNFVHRKGNKFMSMNLYSSLSTKRVLLSHCGSKGCQNSNNTTKNFNIRILFEAQQMLDMKV